LAATTGWTHAAISPRTVTTATTIITRSINR
jgi:hypothetical protein